MESRVSSIKLNIIEILYTELTHKEIKSALTFIIKKIMINRLAKNITFEF